MSDFRDTNVSITCFMSCRSLQFRLVRADFASQGTPGNVWRQFWLSQGESAIGIQLVEARDAAKHPTIYRTVPLQKKKKRKEKEKTNIGPIMSIVP